MGACLDFRPKAPVPPRSSGLTKSSPRVVFVATEAVTALVFSVTERVAQAEARAA